GQGAVLVHRLLYLHRSAAPVEAGLRRGVGNGRGWTNARSVGPGHSGPALLAEKISAASSPSDDVCRCSVTLLASRTTRVGRCACTKRKHGRPTAADRHPHVDSFPPVQWPGAPTSSRMTCSARDRPFGPPTPQAAIDRRRRLGPAERRLGSFRWMH